MDAFSAISPELREKAKLYERVRAAFARLRAESVGGWVFREGEVEVWACPWVDVFNGLMSPRWSSQNAGPSWRRAVQLYKATGQGMFVSFGPSTTADNLREIIRRDGFRCSYHVPFMHLDLDRLRDFPHLPGVSVELVTDFEIFRKQEHPWIGKLNTRIQKTRFRFVREQAQTESPDLWQFVARADEGRIVGSSLLFRHENEGAIFDVARPLASDWPPRFTSRRKKPDWSRRFPRKFCRRSRISISRPDCPTTSPRKSSWRP